MPFINSQFLIHCVVTAGALYSCLGIGEEDKKKGGGERRILGESKCRDKGALLQGRKDNS